MKIASWNVNSIRSRLPHVLDWLAKESPDVLLLQELKGQEENFPFLELTSIGYHATVLGEKTYNGVAILSKEKPTNISRAIDFEHARYIEADIAGYRIASVYVPNGSEVGSEKWAYKQDFLEKLLAHIEEKIALETPYIIGGDFNIAPTDLDHHITQGFDILCTPKIRAYFRRMLNLGLIDSFRFLHPEAELYSWWDYRGGAFPQNKGARIDQILLSPLAANRLQSAGIDDTPRALEKPSDHTPVFCVLDASH
ncbi:MAG: exodeoxyribonuclease III [Alphaproteobacteria bacterium]